MAQLDALAKQYRDKQEHDDYHVALVCSILAEINRNPKKRHKPFTPADFMPRKKERHQMTDEEMKLQLGIIARTLGGEVKHG